MSEYDAGQVVPGFLDNGNWSGSFGVSYRDLCIHDAATTQHVIRPGFAELRNVVGSGGLVRGRNEIAARFLDATRGEWLWTVDTDMSFAADTVERLVKSADPVERPVMGALCFSLITEDEAPFYARRFGIRPTLYRYVQRENECGFQAGSAWPADQIVGVSGTGAACLLIHRTVLETVRERYKGDVWYDTLTHPTGDKGKPRVFSEDLSFMIRLAGCDIPVHVDTAVKTAHDKGGIFLDEEMFARQQVMAKFLAEQSAEVGDDDRESVR